MRFSREFARNVVSYDEIFLAYIIFSTLRAFNKTKKNQEKLIKTEVLLIKTCFSLFAFVFICF